MNIPKISVPSKIKTVALLSMFGVATYNCIQSRNEYINCLKETVKENVDEETYKNYLKEAEPLGAEEAVFRRAYDSIQFANKYYFEGGQAVRLGK